MMDLDDLERIAAASHNLPLNDLRHFIKYLSSFPREDNNLDHVKLNHMVHVLQNDINKRKTFEYGFFAYV